MQRRKQKQMQRQRQKQEQKVVLIQVDLHKLLYVETGLINQEKVTAVDLQILVKEAMDHIKQMVDL